MGILRLQHSGLVELQSGQDAADGGPAEAGGLGDAHAGPALASQPLHALDQFCRKCCGAIDADARLRSRKRRIALGAEPLAPTWQRSAG